MTGLGETRIARRYASALFATARRLGRDETVRADLDAIMEVRRESTALQKLLDSPLVPATQKLEMTDRALASADEVTRRFLHLLIAKRRTDILPAIYEEYQRCADTAAGVARAYVTSAAPMSEAERAHLADALARRLDRPVQMHVRVEPAMLGGIAVRVGDTVWDGSIRGALETMREQMLEESAMADVTQTAQGAG